MPVTRTLRGELEQHGLTRRRRPVIHVDEASGMSNRAIPVRLLEGDGVVKTVERSEFAREEAREVTESARVSLHDLGEVHVESLDPHVASHEGVPFSLDLEPRFRYLVSKARSEIGVARDGESIAQHGRNVAVVLANAHVLEPLELTRCRHDVVVHQLVHVAARRASYQSKSSANLRMAHPPSTLEEGAAVLVHRVIAAPAPRASELYDHLSIDVGGVKRAHDVRVGGQLNVVELGRLGGDDRMCDGGAVVLDVLASAS